MRLTRFLSATALAGSLLVLPTVAMAQDTPAPADATQGEETAPAEETQGSQVITVTGSRIARPNLESTVPITSINAQELTDTGNLSLGDTLNRLPSLRGTFSQANSTRFIGTAGLNLLDLRGLGTARTLVLVDGRRHITATPGSYAVDVNTIPTDLVERVDIVTGGNSAIYGSDAVAGVVNFVLKKDFDGLTVRAQGGVSERGDRGSAFISGVWGTNFWDNRANLSIAVEYAKSEKLLFSDRNDQTGAYTGVPGFFTTDNTVGEPASGDGIPDTSLFGPYDPGNMFGIISMGGTVNTVCPAASADPLVTARRAAVCTGELSPTGGRLSDNYVFLPDGTLVRDDPTLDLRSVGGGRFGGLTATGIEGAMLLPGLERINANLLFNVEVSSAFKPFFEGKFVRVKADQQSTQPTFINSTLSPTFFLDNPFLTEQARAAIRTVQGYAPTNTTGSFTMFRFNNDIGTRAEDHQRDTFRLVGGVRGDIASTGNWRYEVAVNYGRTETYYETGGNVDIAKFNRAANAVRNGAGQIVCRVNADASTTNDDPACRPINLFGQNAPATTPDGLAYVLYTSSREQWATEFNAIGYISGDTSGFFNLPGGPVGIVLGAEYRKEDAFSDYDNFTQSGATFLNSIAEFDPPSVNVKEAFGEINIPLLSDVPFFHDLSLQGAARVSDYSSGGDPVWAYNLGAYWSPVSDLRFRGTYARSVRAPDLSDLYATQSQTFANNLTDPCDQPGGPNSANNVSSNPNRARNCAAAGIPTTITLPDGSVVPWINRPTSGISGINGGNPTLEPEVGTSWTVGAVFQPRFVPGLSVTVDYYNITIDQAISGLTGQAIINRCYDDPVGIDNPFCDAVFRRTSTDPIANGTFAGQAGRRFDGFTDFDLTGLGITPGFLNVPFNFQQLKTSGIDVDVQYRRTIGEVKLDVRAIVSWLENREFFTYITDPTRSDRVHGLLGDPEWSGALNVDLEWRNWDFGWDMRFLGSQAIAAAWETMFSHQGRSPTNADAFPYGGMYPRTFYHDIQIGYSVNDDYRFYFGIDNVMDTLPPYYATGTTAGGAIFPVEGRFFYAGVRFDM